MNAAPIANAKWRASASDASPPTSRAILDRYSHMMARIEPNWIMTVKTSPGSE
jgi:hypothetical protein